MQFPVTHERYHTEAPDLRTKVPTQFTQQCYNNRQGIIVFIHVNLRSLFLIGSVTKSERHVLCLHVLFGEHL